MCHTSEFSGYACAVGRESVRQPFVPSNLSKILKLEKYWMSSSIYKRIENPNNMPRPKWCTDSRHWHTHTHAREKRKYPCGGREYGLIAWWRYASHSSNDYVDILCTRTWHIANDLYCIQGATINFIALCSTNVFRIRCQALGIIRHCVPLSQVLRPHLQRRDAINRIDETKRGERAGGELMGGLWTHRSMKLIKLRHLRIAFTLIVYTYLPTHGHL